jgi:hypothetical protein
MDLVRATTQALERTALQTMEQSLQLLINQEAAAHRDI